MDGLLVADHRSESIVKLKGSSDIAMPALYLLKPGIGLAAVVVHIVIIADVGELAGENQINQGYSNPRE